MPGYSKLRLPQQYRDMLDLDASGFAWEWLRRNPAYRALWATASASAKRASAQAAAGARRTATIVTKLSQHPLGRRSARLGLTFPVPPDVPATDRPLLGWSPELRTDALTLVRPVAWARSLGLLRFTPARWGNAYRLEAEGGAHLLIRRHGEPELALWLPTELEPVEGEGFGLFVHPDEHHSARVAAVARFRRSIGFGRPLRRTPYRDANRHAAMLAISDGTSDGISLYDLAATFLPAMPADWRTSSERSDFRRLNDCALRMVASDYRTLLQRSSPSG